MKTLWKLFLIVVGILAFFWLVGLFTGLVFKAIGYLLGFVVCVVVIWFVIKISKSFFKALMS